VEFADQVSTHSGMTLDAFVAERAKDTGFRQAVLQAKLIQKRSGEALTVTPEEIKVRYERDLAEVYTHPEMVRASHILIATDQLKTDAEKATARAEAEAILVDVKKADADFAAVAGARSSCPSRTQGGDLGFFPRKDAMVEPFAVVAFGLKEGEISEVVETQFGYHIIKATGRKPESVATLAEASSTIRDELEAEKMSAARKDYVATLRETAKIVHLDAVEPMPK
jgi:peptidyl-prolyl cis-trans isomerase C